MKFSILVLTCMVAATASTHSWQLLADDDTSATNSVVSTQQQAAWNAHVTELLKIGRAAADDSALPKAQQHYSMAAAILPSPELEHAIAIALFNAGRHADAAKHLEQRLQHQGQHDSEALALYCHCCLQSGGRYLSDIAKFAPKTIDVMEQKETLDEADEQQLLLIGTLVAVVPELDRVSARIVKLLATLDRNVRKNRNTIVLRSYLTGYDGLEQLLMANAKPLAGRALAEKQAREAKLQKVAANKRQIDAQQEELAADRKANALALQKQVDLIDKWIIPRHAAAQPLLARLNASELQLVQIQAAMQGNMNQSQRLQLLNSQQRCIAEQNNLKAGLAPFITRVNERSRLVEMYKTESGREMQANLALAGLEQDLNRQQGNLAGRLTAAGRGKQSNREIIPLVFPIDEMASTTNLATLLDLNIPQE